MKFGGDVRPACRTFRGRRQLAARHLHLRARSGVRSERPGVDRGADRRRDVQRQPPPVTTSHPTKYYVGFVQDDWRVRPNVTRQPRAALRAALRQRQRGSRPGELPVAIPYVDVSNARRHEQLRPAHRHRLGRPRQRQHGGARRLRPLLRPHPPARQRSASSATPAVLDQHHQPAVSGSVPGAAIRATSSSRAPPNITVVGNDMMQPTANQFNGGLSQRLSSDIGASRRRGLQPHAERLQDRRTSTSAIRSRCCGRCRSSGAHRSDPAELRPEIQGGLHQAREALQPPTPVPGLVHLHRTATTTTRWAATSTFDHLGLDEGPSNGERRHAVVASGSVLLPYDITIGALWTVPLAAAVDGDGRARPERRHLQHRSRARHDAQLRRPRSEPDGGQHLSRGQRPGADHRQPHRQLARSASSTCASARASSAAADARSICWRRRSTCSTPRTCRRSSPADASATRCRRASARILAARPMAQGEVAAKLVW